MELTLNGVNVLSYQDVNGALTPTTPYYLWKTKKIDFTDLMNTLGSAISLTSDDTPYRLKVLFNRLVKFLGNSDNRSNLKVHEYAQEYCRGLCQLAWGDKVPDPIHVVLCGNKQMYHHLPALMYSILAHTLLPVSFHILCTDWMGASADVLVDLCRFDGGSSVSFYPVDLDRELAEFTMDTTDPKSFAHISKDTYLRVLIPGRLKGVNRAIYLDIDTIVVQDIKRLWDFDLEGKLMAMALEPDPAFQHRSKEVIVPHFQAGVILMDLEAMRQAGFESRMRSRAKKEVESLGVIFSQDQGLLNREFEGEVKSLPLYFNFCAFVLGYWAITSIERDLDILYLMGSYAEMNKITIYHYSGPNKAWNNPNSRYFYYKDRAQDLLETPNYALTR